MSRYVIAENDGGREAWLQGRWAGALMPVLDLPDAEHIHLHRRPDGTWHAVAMEDVEVDYEPRNGVISLRTDRAVTDYACEPLWRDVLADPEEGARD